LSLDFVSVFELAEDRQTLRMVTGFGWNHGVAQSAVVSAKLNSMASYVLGSCEPVIMRDARTITAFEIPDFVRSHGVISGMSVVVPGQPKPWGILEAQSRRSRIFVEDDFHFLQSVANVISTAHSRKQAEAERAHLAAFVEHNPNPFIELGPEGEFFYCNDAARATTRALGKVDPSELLPSRVSELVKNCLERDINVLNEPAEIGKRTFNWSLFPIARMRRVHGYAVDVTERLSLEAQLRQSQKMEAIGQLAAGVAHDFNNILTIMQGLIRRLERSATRDQCDMLEQLFDTTERGASLTRQLLAFSRRQLLQRSAHYLGDIVENMSRMLQRLISETISLKVERAENMPAVEVDAAMVEQIILNLVVNARDAMPRGGELLILTDAVEVATATETKSWARLRVRDTGSGIPPEARPHIFEPFFTTKEVGKGTGLGLATVFGIVKQHGGTIEVESETDKGTTFTILFPPTDKKPEGKTAALANSVKRGSGETILLVEDEPLLRELAHSVLADAGYKVIDAEKGAEAFDVWKNHESEIDLLVTDMVLPGGVTGRELALQLQESKPKLKVIYTTGYSAELLDAQGEPVNFLQKPYPPEMLTQTVRMCLDAA
jgi:signal transduction histidine kinase